MVQGTWLGVELDTAEGKNDGSVAGERCKDPAHPRVGLLPLTKCTPSPPLIAHQVGRCVALPEP